jgi:3-oxoacyl-[acyl-carrier protein] reductase
MTRIALITGGASGLGLATARRLAADGLTVAIADLRADAAREAAAGIGPGHLGLQVDVAQEESVQALFKAVETQLGPVAVLACFAGLLSTAPRPGRLPLVELGVDEWDRLMAVNGRGTFLCVREMLRRRATGARVEHGRIVTVASLAGQVGGQQSGAAYSASKGAVLSLSKVAAREAAPLGITVNTIAPGPIDTPMLAQTVAEGNGDQKYLGVAQVPLGRIGTPDEIATAVSYLVSPGAGFVTGATLDVNGGMSMR